MYAYILKYCIHFISFCFIYPANSRSRLNKLRLSYSKRWMLTFLYQLDNYWKPDIVVRRLTSNVYFFFFNKCFQILGHYNKRHLHLFYKIKVEIYKINLLLYYFVHFSYGPNLEVYDVLEIALMTYFFSLISESSVIDISNNRKRDMCMSTFG